MSARAVVLISDGGSTDEPREVARDEEIMPWQEKNRLYRPWYRRQGDGIPGDLRGDRQARVASFIDETGEMTTAESERVAEEQAEIFEKSKSYLVKHWEAEERESSSKGVLQKVFGSWVFPWSRERNHGL